MIEVRNLTKQYGQIKAVDQISFDVNRGEIIGFLGPNGAGKTTTMRILTCFMPATSGTAKIAGFDVFEEPLEVKKRVGYLPEIPPLYSEMTVKSYLDYVATIKAVPSQKRKEAVSHVIDRCALDSVKNRLIGHLSKGFRQRVGLAQALVHNPQILILDEPTIGLDPKQIIEIRKLIKELSGDHTVILSTHILPEVTQLCQRIIILNQGKIVAVDTYDQLAADLRKTNKIELKLRKVDSAVEKIKSIPDVLNVAIVNRDQGILRVECNLNDRVREEIAKAVVQHGLLEMRLIDYSLEEVFLKLTTQEEGGTRA
jgi:ABC-2 type transport system ATP-binding protein